ncbi:MAG: hypothetical protein JWQ91_912 [Aeromicrobium sp.]|nr:hypothetical protein [Aeromicrobium sp.]
MRSRPTARPYGVETGTTHCQAGSQPARSPAGGRCWRLSSAWSSRCRPLGCLTRSTASSASTTSPSRSRGTSQPRSGIELSLGTLAFLTTMHTLSKPPLLRPWDDRGTARVNRGEMTHLGARSSRQIQVPQAPERGMVVDARHWFGSGFGSGVPAPRRDRCPGVSGPRPPLAELAEEDVGDSTSSSSPLRTLTIRCLAEIRPVLSSSSVTGPCLVWGRARPHRDR